MTEYILIDAYNEDVLYKGNNLNEAKKIARQYDYETEGDWAPVFGSRPDSKEQYHLCAFKF